MTTGIHGNEGKDDLAKEYMHCTHMAMKVRMTRQRNTCTAHTWQDAHVCIYTHEMMYTHLSQPTD